MGSADEGITVVLRFGKLDVMSPTALALIGKEVIKFHNAELIDKNKYKLSNLVRGQEGTKKYEHTSGEKFVLLDDSIISFEVQRGKKFFLKAVTYGDSLDNTSTKAINN